MNSLKVTLAMALLLATFSVFMAMPTSTTERPIPEFTAIEREFAQFCYYGVYHTNIWNPLATDLTEAIRKNNHLCQAIKNGLLNSHQSPAFESLHEYGYHPDEPVRLNSLALLYNETARIDAQDKKHVTFCFAYHFNDNATKCWGWTWGPLIEMSEQDLKSLPNVNPRLFAAHKYIHDALKLTEQGWFIHPTTGKKCRRDAMFLYDIKPAWMLTNLYAPAKKVKITPECELK